MEKTKAARLLALLQLVCSALLAASIVYGYATYRSSLGQFTEALSASIVSVSNVVGRTAETVESKQSVIESSKQTLLAFSALVKQLNTSALSQARQGPQLAESLRSASALVERLGDTLNSIGEGLMFSAPTGWEMEGLRPIVVMTRPLKNQGQLLLTDAQNIKAVGTSLLNASGTIANDGAKLGTAFVAMGEQTLRLLEETVKTLDRLQGNDLPVALQEMKSTSENLRNVSQQMKIASDISISLLIFGLLLSVWCFLNSLSHLMLIKQYENNPDRQSLQGEES